MEGRKLYWAALASAIALAAAGCTSMGMNGGQDTYGGNPATSNASAATASSGTTTGPGIYCRKPYDC
jgi:hypothetical protein